MRFAVAPLFAAIVAVAHADEMPVGKDFTNTIGMKFVRIEPGEFVMGEGLKAPKTREEFIERDYDESPAHRVKISQAYYLGIYEVTNAVFEQFDPDHKLLRGRDSSSKTDNDPVAYVTWQQANDFCKWLSKKEGRVYRLPTEAEWEYACRAGTTTKFSTGDKLSPEQANFGLSRDNKSSDSTQPVGSYEANPWGLFDMHGNVEEWCADWHGPYDATEQTDPIRRASGYARICRGWSYFKTNEKLPPTRFCRSANRSGHLPDDASRYTGFRVAIGQFPSTKPLPTVLETFQKDVRQTAATKAANVGEKPYFVDYSQQGNNPKMPADSWGPLFAAHNHFAACCVCPNGDVLAVWYTTTSESDREMGQACSRLRAESGKFDLASSFWDVPDVNDHAPVLFCDGKRIFHFFTQSLRGWDNASDYVRWSDDNGVTWSSPRIMVRRDDRDHLSQPCQAIRAKDGALIVACDGDNHRDERLVVSRDDGQTWQVAKGDIRAMAGVYAIHPTLCQRNDGALISFVRGPHPMLMMVSTDFGDSWTKEATKFPGISVGQKATCLKLASGAILLVSMDSKRELFGGGAFAALSTDDGKTWPQMRKLGGVQGYMAAAQGFDGRIHVIGSRMSCVTFNEAWIKDADK